MNCRGGCRYRGEDNTGLIDGIDPLCDVLSKDLAFELFKENVKITIQKEEIPDDCFLDFQKVITRKEDFGAVMLSENGGWLFLDVDGYKLVESCIEKKLVSTNDLIVTQYKKFFLRLLNSNVVSLTATNKE